MFLVVFVCLAFRSSDYLKCKERICIEVCLEPRNNLLDFGDDPHRTNICMKRFKERCVSGQ